MWHDIFEMKCEKNDEEFPAGAVNIDSVD